MLKKIIIFTTVIFLLFEVIYFDSNKRINKLSSKEDKLSVYELVLSDEKKSFLNDYQDIILEEDNDVVTILTNRESFIKIKENYPDIIVK